MVLLVAPNYARPNDRRDAGTFMSAAVALYIRVPGMVIMITATKYLLYHDRTAEPMRVSYQNNARVSQAHASEAKTYSTCTGAHV